MMNILSQINAAEMIEIIGLIVLPVLAQRSQARIWMSKRFTRLEDQIANLPCVRNPNVWCDRINALANKESNP